MNALVMQSPLERLFNSNSNVPQSFRLAQTVMVTFRSTDYVGQRHIMIGNKKLVVTSASLLGASALLVVTRSYLLHFWVGLNPTRPAKDVCSALGQVRWALRTTIPVGQTWLRGLKSLQ